MQPSILKQKINFILFSVLLISCNQNIKQERPMKVEKELTEASLKEALYTLIEPDENFGMAQLDAIYHDDLKVIMIDPEDNKQVYEKNAFKELINTKLAGEERTKNTWAKFLHIEVSGKTGLIVVKRRVNLTDVKKEIKVILDFIWEDNRWQITREVIFV